MVKAPGAFICLGLILAGMNCINRWQSGRSEGEPVSVGCQACGACGGCAGCQGTQLKPMESKAKEG